MDVPIKKKQHPHEKSATEMRQDVNREQLKLNHAENEITKLLTLINEHINVLKVEELQLQANAVSIDVKLLPTKQEPSTSTSPPESHEEINKQDLDLDLMVSNIFNNMEEEDSD